MTLLFAITMLLAAEATEAPPKGLEQAASREAEVQRPPAGRAASFEQALDDVLRDAAEAIAGLAREDVSPLAVGAVHLSANLDAAVADSMIARMTSLLAKEKGLAQVVCDACFSVKSEVQGGEWVVRRGITDRETVKRLGAELGVRAFVTLGLTWVETSKDTPDYLALDVRVVRAANSTVLFAERFVSHESTGAVARGEYKKPPTVEERKNELVRLMKGEPRYAHNILAGMWYVPVMLLADTRVRGYPAITLGYRIYENFGPWGGALFYGFQVNAFIVPQTIGSRVLAGGAITGLFGGTVAFANTLIPRIRFGAQVGGYIGGPYGSTVLLGAVLELITRIGIGVTSSVHYLPPGLGLDGDVSGAGVTVGASYVFE